MGDYRGEKKAKARRKHRSILEQILIGAFFAIILLAIGIAVHRTVTNSDAYKESRAQSQLNESLERLSRAQDIDYVQVDRRGEETVNYYDVDASTFNGICKAEGSERISDPEVQNHIFLKGDCITIFYTDGEYDLIFLSEEGDLYWRTSYLIECPALLAWLDSH